MQLKSERDEKTSWKNKVPSDFKGRKKFFISVSTQSEEKVVVGQQGEKPTGQKQDYYSNNPKIIIVTKHNNRLSMLLCS